MNNFYYQIPTEIYFGKGQMEQLGQKVAQYGTKVLLVYGGGSIKRTGLYGTVYSQLEQYGLEVLELSGVDPNPRIETVRAGVELCKANGIEVIVGVGGGSAIDCSKVISAGAKYEGDSWDLVAGSAAIKETLPVITIPTLAASGSEMNRFAVISNQETHDKIGVLSPLFYPQASFLDPENTFTVPQNQTAAGTADIMSHIIERYFNNVEGAYVQNRIAEGLLKTCIHYGPVAYSKPDDYEARANLMWAASLAIDGITWRGNDVASSVHPIEHELSAYYDITHGVGLAIVTPHWMKYVLNEKTVGRFVEYGVNVWGIDPALDEFEIANMAIDKTSAFFRTLELPVSLSEVGIDGEFLGVMAEKAAKRLGKAFQPLTAGDVLAIFRAAM